VGGGAQQTRASLSQIIKTGLEQHIIKANQPVTYARPEYRVQSFDMSASNPRAIDKKEMNQVGYTKTNFFWNFGYRKPAVIILVFDWRELKDFDWANVHHKLLLNSVKDAVEKWLKDLNTQSKLFLIVMFPSTGLSQKDLDSMSQ
jgi:hypothetical protein